MTSKALYKIHCITFAIARGITQSGNITTVPDHPFHGFRCFPQYRTEAGKKLRRAVYLKLKERRKNS